MKIIVAIDGFAASGKSTIAQDLAEKTGNSKNDILERDKIDGVWTHPAKDAIRIENGSKPLDEIVQNLLAIFDRVTEN